MTKKIFKILSGPFILFFMYLLYFFGFPIPCLFHKITNLYCPGCGITRCLVSFFHLNFYQSFRYNPLLFIFIPFLLFYVIYRYIIFCFDLEDKITVKIPNSFWYILLIITLIFGVLRNIPIFSYLKPTKII